MNKDNMDNETEITEAIMYKDLPQEEDYYPPENDNSLSITFKKTLETEKRYKPDKPIELCPPTEYDINKENEGTEEQESYFKIIKLILNIDLFLSILYITAITSSVTISHNLAKYILIYPVGFLIPSSLIHFFYIMDIQFYPTERQIKGVLRLCIFLRFFLVFLLFCFSVYVTMLISDQPEMFKVHVIEKLGFKVKDLWGMGLMQFQTCCLFGSIALVSEAIALVYFWCQVAEDHEDLDEIYGTELRDDGIQYTQNRLRGRL